MNIAEVEIYKLFLLVLVRFSGLMVTAPVLGSNSIPMRVRVGLAALTAMVVTPALPQLSFEIPDGPLGFGVLAIGEFLIGLIIGFVVSLVFSAIQVGGQIMDMQSGFALMNVFNPAVETQFPIFGFFLFILAVLVLLVTGGHRLMLWALYQTYAHVEIGGFVARPELLWEVSRWGRDMFIDGVMIAAPVGTAMLMAYLVMGLIGRVVPQIHLFVVGFPVTIGMALMLTALTLGAFLAVLDGMFYRAFEKVETLVYGLG